MFFTRVDAIPYDIGNIGGYVQQKIDGRNFDGWRALRDGSYWGPESYWKALGTDAIQNMNPAYAEGFGDAFKLFKSKASSLPELVSFFVFYYNENFIQLSHRAHYYQP